MNRLTLFGICLALAFVDTALAQPGTTDSGYSAMTYRMVGPSRGGRVTAIAGVPTNPPILYFGSTGGGVWKTTNNGVSYQNISDGYFAVASIGAVDVAPSDADVIYVGTGSDGIRSNVSTGRGVYKSTDAGKTWRFAGLRNTGQIGTVDVHPTNPDIAFVAAMGQAFGPNPERGIFRTTDGGENWEHVLSISDSTGASDVEIRPDNPDVVFAAMWRGERKPWTIISGGYEGGIFKSTDGGETWNQLTNGLPDGLVGKTELAISPVDPDRIYALIEAPVGTAGLYRSDDGGDRFELINEQKSLLYRPFYYTHVVADPVDRDRVYVPNETLFRSDDAGKSFRRVGTPHGDNHGIWIHPEDPDFLFQSNDGGVNVSLDGGASWTTQLNQPTAELYHVVVDNQEPYWLYGEQQDNTTIAVPSVPPAAAGQIDPRQDWMAVAGCETGPIAPHPTDPDIIYGGCKGRFGRFNKRTGQEKRYWVYPHFNYGHEASEMPFRFQRTSPIEISPHDPATIYHGSQFVHRTTDEGVNWETISEDLTANPEHAQGHSGGPITRDITGEEIYSAIYQIRESPVQKGVIWVGSNDGPLHVSRDGGNSWTDVTPPDLPPGGRVQTIDPSSFDAGRAYVAIYRYMLGDFAPYIYRTTDFGSSWERLTDGTNGIPDDFPTRVVREDPNRPGLLYAGTEFGMFLSQDDGATWQSFQQNLPVTPITDMRIHRRDLVISTMGRSFWILDDLTPLYSEGVNLSENTLFPMRPTTRFRWSTRRRAEDPSAPEYPRSGAFFYYSLASKVDSVSVDVIDESGALVRQLGGLPSGSGMHRALWPLSSDGPLGLSGQAMGDGPMVPPGTFTVRLNAGEFTASTSVDLRLDPRVAADGVTDEDVVEQYRFNRRLVDMISTLNGTLATTRDLSEKLTEASEKSRRVRRRGRAALEELDRIENALVQTEEGKVGAQLQPMLYRQLTYLSSMTDRADQKLGSDAFQRLGDMEVELNEHLAALETVIASQISPLSGDMRKLGVPIDDVIK